MSYELSSHQTWWIRLMLLFCRARRQDKGNGWVFVVKKFRGRDYLVDIKRERVR